MHSGEKWKTRRRIVTSAFHFKILNTFMDVFNKQSLIHATKLEQEIVTQQGRELNILPLITQCALDIICSKSIH